MEGHLFAERPGAATGKEAQPEQAENQERKESRYGAKIGKLRG